MKTAKKIVKAIKKQRSIPIEKRIAKLYEKRNKAYDMMMEVDIAVDDLLRELAHKI